MGLSGFAHTIGGHHAGHAAPSSHAGHHVAATRGAGGLRGGARGGTRALWALLSPRTLFSVLLGFGTTGLLLHPFVSGALLLGLGVAGGLAFELGLVRPLWNFLFRFESAPAL